MAAIQLHGVQGVKMGPLGLILKKPVQASRPELYKIRFSHVQPQLIDGPNEVKVVSLMKMAYEVVILWDRTGLKPPPYISKKKNKI